MKEYRLLAWPELPSEFQRTAHRRVLSDLSARYMTSAQLIEVSGLKKGDHLYLVDGSGYLFRAYHALPPLTRKRPLTAHRAPATVPSSRAGSSRRNHMAISRCQLVA